MTSHEGVERLHHKIDQLSPQGVDVVSGVVDAILTPTETVLLEGSWLTTPEWAEGFTARLHAHHALSREPLSTTQFEAAFEAACESAGWHVTPAASATQRFFDTVVSVPGYGAKSLSLKASSARDMRRGWVHISKLTEAAWIQDARRQVDRRDRIVELFREYREAATAIVMLRGFELEHGVDYELIEIPTSLFEVVDSLDVARAQNATISFPPDARPPDFKIRIDRSDSKITLTGILLDRCLVHGRWALGGQGGA
ncbi:hypothetical protein B0T36_14650 [Nocardia donostiensis]|uniref:hypothetical protein n=1 Tax=Nocardia donostiensis TaxID=1538463 RepID=UPI0009DA5B11|nr:hypothetical protein [Nocardia donostiensis]OQS14253.1 hypothetical protein B0T36_14650 [Nocardia donostiensis]